MDSVEYQPGNICLATNIPVSAPKGTSKELQLTVQGVYYVKTVSPSHLRLVHLFTGEERTLPREHCTKITLDNLSTLQIQLQSHQLQKVADTLFRANKYLTPNQTKTWNYLLNRDRNHISSGIDLNTEYENFLQTEEQTDLPLLQSTELPTDSELVSKLPGQNEDQLIQTEEELPAHDVFNNPTDSLDETLLKKTRSGRVYSLHVESSILKMKPHEYHNSLDPDIQITYVIPMDVPTLSQVRALQAYQQAQDLHQTLLLYDECFDKQDIPPSLPVPRPHSCTDPTYETPSSRKTVRFKDTLEVRFIIASQHGETFFHRQQEIKDKTSYLTTTHYLMLSSIGLDISK